MKVKVALRFRGREMAHQEFGFKVVQNFIKDVANWGHPDAPPKLIGKGLNVMLSPHPRAKRAPHPRADSEGNVPQNENPHQDEENEDSEPRQTSPRKNGKVSANSSEESKNFAQNSAVAVEDRVGR
jgi:translation initiation factor IF-3